MESFGELEPSNQTGISAKSCGLKSAAGNPFKNTSAEVPLYNDCLCIPDVIPAVHDNHVGSTCSCLNQKPNEMIGFFLHSTLASAFSFCHLTLTSSPLLSLISDLKVMGVREVLSGGNYEGLTGDFPWSQIFNFLTFKSHWQYMQESMRVVCGSLIYLNRFSTIWMFEVSIYTYLLFWK